MFISNHRASLKNSLAIGKYLLNFIVALLIRHYLELLLCCVRKLEKRFVMFCYYEKLGVDSFNHKLDYICEYIERTDQYFLQTI